jgi:iron(III) transport system substrate-binding protein
MKTTFNRRDVLKAGTALTASTLFAEPIRAAAPPAEAVTPALIAAAKKEGKVIHYTSVDLPLAEKVGKAFEAKYPGITVRIERTGAERVFTRIAQERGSNIHACDVVQSSDAAHFVVWKREGILAPYVPEEVAKHYPPEHKDADGLFASYRVYLCVMGRNTDLVKAEDAPKSYKDLLDPKWKGKLAIETGDYDWFSVVVSSMGEEKGIKLFRDIVAKNGVSVRKGHTLIANLVVSGEVPVSLTTYLYKVAQLKKDGAPIDWFSLPPEVARAQGTGMAAKAPHPNAAVLFIDFLLSDGQSILGKRDFIPTNTKVQPVPEGLTLKFVEPAKILDESSKWEKLFNDTFVNVAR